MTRYDPFSLWFIGLTIVLVVLLVVFVVVTR